MKWERQQAELAAKVTAGAPVPARVPPRPDPKQYEGKADVLSRVAGDALAAEARAVRVVEAEYYKVQSLATAYAVERQRAQADHTRSVLAEALGQVEQLREDRSTGLAARTSETAFALAEANGRSPEAAHTRYMVERASAYTSSAFASRDADRHDGRLAEAMSTLRNYVESVATEDFSAAWPDGTDPAVTERTGRELAEHTRSRLVHGSGRTISGGGIYAL